MKKFTFVLISCLALAGCGQTITSEVTSENESSSLNNSSVEDISSESSSLNEENSSESSSVNSSESQSSSESFSNEEISSEEISGGETVEVIKDGYVVYINLDAFGRYYYDIAKERNLVPTLESIASEGVVFKGLKTLPPSVTNPVQAMIISGASSAETHNVYRYYDKKSDMVIQQGRENDADTLYKSTKRNNLTGLTVHHFPASTAYSPTNKNALYVTTPFGVVSNYASRFDQAIKIVKGETFTNDSTLQKLDEVPRFMSIYCDDLDALGHNFEAYDTFKVAKSEEERVNNVVTRLGQIDGKLKEFMDACKERGIYDKMTFFLTTDHGMQGYGAETEGSKLTSKYSKSKWPDLQRKLKEIDKRFIFEYVAQNKKPKADTTAVGCGFGLQMPITFRNLKISEAELQKIKVELKKEEYISEVFTRVELIKEGFWRGANVDLLVVPSERYHFHGRDNKYALYACRGQHDTFSYNATHVYGAIWGAHIKKLGEIEVDAKVTSFGSTMAEILNIDLLNKNAPILKDIIDYNETK